VPLVLEQVLGPVELEQWLALLDCHSLTMPVGLGLPPGLVGLGSPLAPVDIVGLLAGLVDIVGLLAQLVADIGRG
jgi:hypothetical protein